MKRVLAFASALALSVGAYAPAVFASDVPSVPVPEDNLSIWDIGSTDIENPYNANDLFDYCQNFWGDLFDDGRFNNQTVSDYQRYFVELGVSKYVSTHPDEVVNGVLTSYFDDIVDYVCNNPSDFDIYWTPDGVVSALTGNPYMNLQFGDDFYNNLYDFIIANYYTVSSVTDYVPPSPSSGSGWIHLAPYIYSGWYIWATEPYSNTFYDAWVAGVGTIGSATQGFAICTLQNGNFVMRYKQGSATLPSNSLGTFSASESITGNAYKYGNQSLQLGLTASYSSVSDAVNDFYRNGYTPSSDPVSNGKVYIRDEPIGGDNLTVSFPSLPVSDSKSVSNYYYDTYGDTWEDNSTVINNNIYNNNTTTVYPITYDNNIPLWLISPSTGVTTYNYSLDLPSVDLEELPTEFEGGGDFFQDSFLALGGFGSFVLIAFSFGLVALFFKG